jgi:hypothetical protein
MVHSNYAASHPRKESSKYRKHGSTEMRLLVLSSAHMQAYRFQFVTSPRTRATCIIPLWNVYCCAFVVELRMEILSPIQRPIYFKISSEITPTITKNCQEWYRHACIYRSYETSLLNNSITYNIWLIHTFIILVLY